MQAVITQDIGLSGLDHKMLWTRLLTTGMLDIFQWGERVAHHGLSHHEEKPCCQ